MPDCIHWPGAWIFPSLPNSPAPYHFLRGCHPPSGKKSPLGECWTKAARGGSGAASREQDHLALLTTLQRRKAEGRGPPSAECGDQVNSQPASGRAPRPSRRASPAPSPGAGRGRRGQHLSPRPAPEFPSRAAAPCSPSGEAPTPRPRRRRGPRRPPGRAPPAAPDPGPDSEVLTILFWSVTNSSMFSR